MAVKITAIIAALHAAFFALRAVLLLSRASKLASLAEDKAFFAIERASASLFSLREKRDSSLRASRLQDDILSNQSESRAMCDKNKIINPGWDNE